MKTHPRGIPKTGLVFGLLSAVISTGISLQSNPAWASGTLTNFLPPSANASSLLPISPNVIQASQAIQSLQLSLSKPAAKAKSSTAKAKPVQGQLKMVAAPATKSVTSSAGNATPALLHITLLQLNDVYQIAPVDKGQRGGLARVATLVKQAKAQNPNTMLVLAGDTLSPSIGSTLFQGKQMIDLWNQLGLGVATLGNHEFDYGDAVLLQRLQESKFPWVVANVMDKTTHKTFAGIPPFLIKDFNGVKVGFLGLLTPDTENASAPGPEVEFEDPVYTACSTLHQMKQQGVDVVVGVTHLPMPEDKRLAKSMPRQIAVILGGHEHTLLTSEAGGTPILKMGSDARNLGKVDLWIDPATHAVDSVDWEIIPVTVDIPEDPAIAASVKGYEDQLNSALGQVIGQTQVELDAMQASSRSRETNLGDFIADAYRTRLGADVAILNGGGIRSNTTYPIGPLTRKDVLSILPFSDPSVKLEVSGKTLKEALENGVSRLEEKEAGRFPQVSGLRFQYDGRKPAGSRVVNVTINGQPLNANKLYSLATSSYLQGGGDDYLMLKSAKVLLKPEETPLDADIVQGAIEQAKTIALKVDGRIQRLDPQ